LDDDFWKSHFPPLGWRCRCYTVQTAAKPTETPVPQLSPKDFPLEFRNNVGISGEIFKETDEFKGNPHPYFALANTDGMEKPINRLIFKIQHKQAKQKLIGKTVDHPKVSNIGFSNGGLKEAFNQPHEEYYDKNLLILYMDTVIPKSEYLGFTTYRARDTIKGSHIFKILINDKPSYIIVREDDGGKRIFYSISDKIKSFEGIKK